MLRKLNNLNNLNSSKMKMKMKLNFNTDSNIISSKQENPEIKFKLNNKTNFQLFKYNIHTPDKKYANDKLIIILRGHIRNSFDNDNLYKLILNISNKYNIRIYIHTWNKTANNLSWKDYPENNNIIDENIIINYFKDLSKFIVSLTIDDDEKIIINGKKDGKLFSGTMNIAGWKNMWYGMKRIMDIVYNNEKDDKLILNIRFDILINSQKIHDSVFFEWLDNTFNETNDKLIKNKFIKKIDLLGVDNQIFGDKHTMKVLIDHFNDLDKINELDLYKNIKIHESVVYLENDRLFD
jgi:hypothetical protein